MIFCFAILIIKMASDSILDYSCNICYQRFSSPHQLIPCGHVFCSNCIHQWMMASGTTCPTCRAIIEYCFPDMRIQRELSNTIVKCLYCPENIAYGQLSKHFCEKKEIACTYCSQSVQYKNMSIHLEECPDVVVQCKECGLNFERKFMESHINKYCGNKALTTCALCGETVSITVFQRHYEHHIRRRSTVLTKNLPE